MEWKNQPEFYEQTAFIRWGTFVSEEPKPEPGAPRSPHHVLEELKSVLSNLGQTVEQPPALEPPPAFEPPPEKNTAEPTPIFSNEKTQQSPPIQPPPASDADFWSGNVLGWPAGTEPTFKDSLPSSLEAPPVTLAPPAFEDPVTTAESFPKEFLEDSIPLPPAAPPAPLFTEPVEIPDAPPPMPFNDAEAASRSDIVMAPEPPESPPPVFQINLSAPDPATEQHVEDFSPLFPIPRTVDEIETQSRGLGDDVLVPKGAETAKPKNLTQLACFFPDGQEKIGQQFVNQLREVSGRYNPSWLIEPVLISSWSSDNIDVTGWKKSAELSGADVIFILAARQDLAHFPTAPAVGFPSEIPVRVVAMEHVPLRTLYNDVLIELKRKV